MFCLVFEHVLFVVVTGCCFLYNFLQWKPQNVVPTERQQQKSCCYQALLILGALGIFAKFARHFLTVVGSFTYTSLQHMGPLFVVWSEGIDPYGKRRGG